MVTVSILNYNGDGILKDCIYSILSQSKVPDEILIVDDFSTDNSRSIIKDFSVTYPSIKFYFTDRNYGFVHGINLCFKQASNPLVMFVSNDVRLHKKCLEELEGYFLDGLDKIVQPVIYSPNGKIENYGSRYCYPAFGFANREMTHKIDFTTMTTFMARKSTIKRMGYFDESFYPAYCEDLDFYMRSAGTVQYEVCIGARATHLGSVSFHNRFKRSQIKKFYRENRRRFIRKHYTGWDRIIREVLSGCMI